MNKEELRVLISNTIVKIHDASEYAYELDEKEVEQYCSKIETLYLKMKGYKQKYDELNG